MIPIILRLYFLQSHETRSAPNSVISLIITLASKGPSPMRLKVCCARSAVATKLPPHRPSDNPNKEPHMIHFCYFTVPTETILPTARPESCDHNTTGIPKLRLAIPLSWLVLYLTLSYRHQSLTMRIEVVAAQYKELPNQTASNTDPSPFPPGRGVQSIRYREGGSQSQFCPEYTLRQV